MRPAPQLVAVAPTTTSNPLTVEVSIEVDTAANLTGLTRRTTATVSSTTPDPNDDVAPGNNTDTAEVTFAGVADLTIRKTADPTVVPGADITWTVTVENLGPSDSLDPITVTDTLPLGMTEFVSAEGVVAADDWDCATTTDALVTCIKGTPLAAGASSAITIVGTVDPDLADPPITAISNTATVTPTTDQGLNTAPDTATNIVNIIEPDVGITKRVDNLTPQPGDTFNYTIELSNTDVADAFAIVVTDDIPAGIAVDPTTIRPAGTLSGTNGVLAPDGVTRAGRRHDHLEHRHPGEGRHPAADLLGDVRTEQHAR